MAKQAVVAELDALLEGVAAQAPRVQAAEDPAQTIRELLGPVRALFLRAVPDQEPWQPTDAVRQRAQHVWSDAATKIQAVVRGKHQRGALQRQMSLHVQGTKILKKYVLKRDRFPNCHVLDTPDGDSAPNFRRLEGSPLYGAAQPTVEGIKQILTRVAADGFKDIVWINLREEAVIYIDGTPFTARRSAKLNENDLVPGITGHTVQVLESSMKTSLQEQLSRSNGHLEYWNEAKLHENEMVSTHVDPANVHTLSEIYETDEVARASDAIKSICYYRIPIERENAPEHVDLEKLMELIRSAVPTSKQVTSHTAFVFNCQMGKRRTTTALVISSLIWQQPHLHVEPAVSPSDPKSPQQSPTHSRRASSSGEFNAIRELIKQLQFGRQAKEWVDRTIDASAAICNIRSVIREYHDLSVSEAKPIKRSYNLHHALSFLERYFYLIVFGSYMMALQFEKQKNVPQKKPQSPQAAKQSANTTHSFSKWLQHHPNLFRLLDDLGGVKYKSDKVLHNAVLKSDHFPGIARIPFTLTQSVPNFRQIAQEPIFGTAQCLEEGIRDVALYTMENSYDRAIWINLREEAVIYVTGKPFVMRHRDNLLQNVEYPGIEVDEIVAIEQQAKEELQAQVRKANGLFMHWYEPRELVNEEKIDYINPEVEIKTLQEIYAEVAEETGFDLRYARIPVSDETAPEEKDLDDLVRLLVPVFAEELLLHDPKGGPTATPKRTAVICNCQMGRGRTTTALVCTYMLRLALEDVRFKRDGYQVTPATSSTTEECGPASTPSQTPLERIMTRAEEAATELRRQSSMTVGDFAVIRRLCNTLANGAEAKALVDFAIDKCEHLQNLRECIAQCRDLAMDRELMTTKHDYYMLRAVNYLERYFYLICFASYLLEERRGLFQQTLFVAWMNERYGSELYALLDNLFFEEDAANEIHASSMRWRWRRKRKLIARLE